VFVSRSCPFSLDDPITIPVVCVDFVVAGAAFNLDLSEGISLAQKGS
jgi:hypothetical protein